jgi:hypothetical protein
MMKFVLLAILTNLKIIGKNKFFFFPLKNFFFSSKRKVKWTWRGEFLPANRNEHEFIKAQLESEKIIIGDRKVSFFELGKPEQNKILMERFQHFFFFFVSIFFFFFFFK